MLRASRYVSDAEFLGASVCRLVDVNVLDHRLGLSSVEARVVCPTKGVFIMRFFTIAMVGFVCLGMAVLALANPSMLPKHPGYPSSGEFANDTGQSNLTYRQSIQDAAKSGDTNMAPSPMDPHNARLLERQEIGRLPILEGTTNKIELPAKETNRMPTKK